jgi:hypothetical protein
MDALELHYGRGKLIRHGLLSLAMSGLTLWAVTAGLREGEPLHGGSAWIFEILGPQGLMALLWACVLLFAALGILYLRRAFGDLVAARADGEGVTLNSAFGTHAWAACDVDRLEIVRTAGTPVLMVVPVPGRGRRRGLAANTLVESDEEVEAWSREVQARLRRRA